MRKILTVKEMITILLDYNMDALVYTNANGVPTGISLPNVCYSGEGDGETKKECKKVIFDIEEWTFNEEYDEFKNNLDY